MKKLCICTTVSITMQSFVVETAKYLQEQCGYDVTLICNEDKAFEASLPEGIRFIPVHMARGIDFSAIASIRRFVQIFKAQQFDLVQYSTPNAACYASIAARLAKVPIRLYCQWGIRYVGLSGVSRKIFQAIERMVCKNSTDIRAVSRKNRDFAVSEGLYPAEKAVVVGNGGTIGVDTAVFDITQKEAYSSELREQYGIPKDAFVFGFCGRLSRDKGSNELLTAFRRICARNENVRLFVVGDVEANSGIDEELLCWAKESESVVFTGSIPKKAVYRYYAPMDVLVHPTYREGFGMVLQEAGAYGIACITTDIPGASEVMEDGQSCLLVQAKDAASLENAMQRLLEDRGLTQRLGQAAYERTKKLYDRPVMLQYQKEDYVKLLER